MRRRFKGLYLMPSIGYGSNRKTRNLLPDGFYKFVVNNVKVSAYTPSLGREWSSQVLKARLLGVSTVCMVHIGVYARVGTGMIVVIGYGK